VSNARLALRRRGQSLEQPAEPDETFKDRIQHPAYPCKDKGGLVFAYMGPIEKMPLFPNYEALGRTDGTRQCVWWPIRGTDELEQFAAERATAVTR
jgi:hypothetical protein